MTTPSDRPKKILLVSAVGRNQWSGMGKWSFKMAEAIEGEGHTATLWFRDDLPAMSWLGRMDKYFTPFAVAWNMYRHRREFDAAVVHEPSASIYALLRHLLGDRLPPVICMCHNVESHCFRTIATATRRGYAATRTKNTVLFHLLNRWLSDVSIWVSDKVVCLSTVDRRYIVDTLGRNDSDVTVMVNGVDPCYFGTRAPRATAAPPTVLFVGGWLDIKGRFVLPEIWHKVHATRPDARLTIVGAGLPAASVLDWFQNHARATVTVVPRVDTEAEIQQFYRTHDIFLMPSLTEGSPLSLLEAMANGMAIVASRTGGIPDIVPNEEGSGAVLFPSCDTDRASRILIELLSDPATIGSLGERAKARARECTWPRSAKVLLESL